ncbi:MAG: hypothetical protein A2020_01590 [Lentisphaerae bacterium GWF2_45_14]|nr:MAG: hypothetical protein A2020_01590 [Lentisphaerae bacterium GWF2_45_14]
MSEDLYNINVEYLKKRSSSVSFSHVVDDMTESDIYDPKPAQDGICSFMAGEKTKVLLHSRRDPAGEAERLVASWIEKSNPDLDGVLIVPGFAGMYHIQAILRRIKPGAMLLVVEKYPEIIRKAMGYCDFRALSGPGYDLIFIASTSEEELKREYRHYLQTRKNLKVSVFIHPGLSRAFPGVYEKLVFELKMETSIELMERNTRIVLSAKWLEHGIFNLPTILNSPGVKSLKDFHKGMPALVIAAGPSLDESAPFIHSVRDKCILISVGRALKPLLSRGITPDYIIHIDSDFTTLQQFEGMDIANSVLLAELVAYPSIVSMFKGRTFFFSVGAAKEFEGWLKIAGVETGCLCAGGTVSLSAIDAALRMGCSKIFFIGLDLAFKDDGTTHASEAAYKEKEVPGGMIVQVKGNYKDKVSTSMQFSDYIKMLNSYLEDVSRDGNTEFFNATTQGAALSNCELVAPSELEKILERSPGIERPLKSPKAESHTAIHGKEKLLGHIQQSISDLRDSAVLAGEMIGACSAVKEKVNYKSVEDRLRTIEKDIKKMELANLLVAGALQGLLFKTMERSAEAHAEGGSRHLLKEFYSNYKGACEWVSKLLFESEKSYKDNKELIY